MYCTRRIRGRRYGRETVGKEKTGILTCLVVSWLPSKFKWENVHVNPRAHIRGVEKKPQINYNGLGRTREGWYVAWPRCVSYLISFKKCWSDGNLKINPRQSLVRDTTSVSETASRNDPAHRPKSFIRHRSDFNVLDKSGRKTSSWKPTPNNALPNSVFLAFSFEIFNLFIRRLKC